MGVRGPVAVKCISFARVRVYTFHFPIRWAAPLPPLPLHTITQSTDPSLWRMALPYGVLPAPPFSWPGTCTIASWPPFSRHQLLRQSPNHLDMVFLWLCEPFHSTVVVFPLPVSLRLRLQSFAPFSCALLAFLPKREAVMMVGMAHPSQAWASRGGICTWSQTCTACLL